MTVTITIKCDNAAFDDPNELPTILTKLAALADRYDGVLPENTPIMDSSGNRVGTVSVSD